MTTTSIPAAALPFTACAEADAVTRAWAAIEPRLDTIMDRFYSDIMLASLASAPPEADLCRIRDRHKTHWRGLFTSRMSDDLTRRMKRMHIAHREVGLPGSLYVTGYLFLLGEFHAAAFAAARDLDEAEAMVQAIDARVGADILNAVTTYYDSMLLD